MAVRALFAGACNGDLQGLFKKVSKVNAKNGPFSVLFCVGNFFPQSGPEEDSCEDIKVTSVLESVEDAPVDTYFIGGYGRGSELGLAALQSGDRNITYLGRSGVVDVKGLSVAFLDGIYDGDRFCDEDPVCSRYYTRKDVADLKEKVNAWEGDIDILLTCEWPDGILKGLAKGAAEGLPEINGSGPISEVAAMVRPRYHIASDAPVHFPRPPYVNPDLGAGSHVTRFISLSPLGIPKQKPLIALQLTSAADMDPQMLHMLPPDSTDFPYGPKTLRNPKRALETEAFPAVQAVNPQLQFPALIQGLPTLPAAQNLMPPPLANQVAQFVGQSNFQPGLIEASPNPCVIIVPSSNPLIPSVNPQFQNVQNFGGGVSGVDLMGRMQVVGHSQSQLGETGGVMSGGKRALGYESRAGLSDNYSRDLNHDGQESWRWQQPKRLKTVKPSRGTPGVVKDRRKTCFVSGLPLSMEEADVKDHFSRVAEVTSIYRGTNAEGKINSWAFIQFESVEAMRQACRELNNSDFGGCDLRVEPASMKDRNDMRNPNKPVDGCWFCLGSDSSDKGLVASVGAECYIAMDKGPISSDHVLIIPTSHHCNTLHMPQGCYTELCGYISALRSMFAASGRSLVAFERFLRLKRTGGSHCIFSVISIPAEKEAEAKKTFMNMCRSHGLDLMCVENKEGQVMEREEVLDLVGDEEYFMALMPDGTRLVRPVTRMDRLPVTFGREVLSLLVGKPERTNWKICVGSEEEERARVERFRKTFAPFDIMNRGGDEDKNEN
ncbi:hypothetical protein BSKO_01223 [Bryopsis sp. KO-2023]|nr:hypothetical protein BSKO_01223 [Bryopsis sp. KO-2023]